MGPGSYGEGDAAPAGPAWTFPGKPPPTRAPLVPGVGTYNVASALGPPRPLASILDARPQGRVEYLLQKFTYADDGGGGLHGGVPDLAQRQGAGGKPRPAKSAQAQKLQRECGARVLAWRMPQRKSPAALRTTFRNLARDAVRAGGITPAAARVSPPPLPTIQEAPSPESARPAPAPAPAAAPQRRAASAGRARPAPSGKLRPLQATMQDAATGLSVGAFPPSVATAHYLTQPATAVYVYRPQPADGGDNDGGLPGRAGAAGPPRSGQQQQQQQQQNQRERRGASTGRVAAGLQLAQPAPGYVAPPLGQRLQPGQPPLVTSRLHGGAGKPSVGLVKRVPRQLVSPVALVSRTPGAARQEPQLAAAAVAAAAARGAAQASEQQQRRLQQQYMAGIGVDGGALRPRSS